MVYRREKRLGTNRPFIVAIVYGTQQGEMSFCAYNTGIGWRNILEKKHMTATLTK